MSHPCPIDLTDEGGAQQNADEPPSGAEADLREVEHEMQQVTNKIQWLLSRQAELQRKKDSLTRALSAAGEQGKDWLQERALTADVKQALKSQFGLSSFRERQLEVIHATLGEHPNPGSLCSRLLPSPSPS